MFHEKDLSACDFHEFVEESFVVGNVYHVVLILVEENYSTEYSVVEVTNEFYHYFSLNFHSTKMASNNVTNSKRELMFL